MLDSPTTRLADADSPMVDSPTPTRRWSTRRRQLADVFAAAPITSRSRAADPAFGCGSSVVADISEETKKKMLFKNWRRV
ncbi:hypothetical protein niasHT_027745 [Heterodera trifolii]|uniref:Uncharacterized protein n=1 Tax=Heterodera trifolii TaxID=157864 RepID=A0ABD2KIT2_9BILA